MRQMLTSDMLLNMNLILIYILFLIIKSPNLVLLFSVKNKVLSYFDIIFI